MENYHINIQLIVATASGIAAIFAAFIAYLTLAKGSSPQLLVHYQPNAEQASLIDLVIENIGGGSALDVTFSPPLPFQCFGIEVPEKSRNSLIDATFPAIAPGQKYVFNGGQYAGLEEALGAAFPSLVAYKYINSFGWKRKQREKLILSIRHLKGMPTRGSHRTAIIEAFKPKNLHTLHEIRDELKELNRSLQNIQKGDAQP